MTSAHRRALAVMLGGALVSGCTTLGGVFQIEQVKPWQKESLARDDMQLVTDVMDSAVDDHLYFSREASTGGSRVQGGGCGCN